jgi:hypothetical protein
VYDVKARYKGYQRSKLAHIGAAPVVHLERMRKQARLKTATLCTLHGPGMENDWNPDWCHARLWITGWQDFSRPCVVCNSNETEQKGGSAGGRHSQISDKNMSKCISKRHF